VLPRLVQHTGGGVEWLGVLLPGYEAEEIGGKGLAVAELFGISPVSAAVVE